MTEEQKKQERNRRAMLRYRRLNGVPENKPKYKHFHRTPRPRAGTGNIEGIISMPPGDWNRLAALQDRTKPPGGVRPARGFVIARALRVLAQHLTTREGENWK